MAWRSGKLNRHLMLRQNWIASSLNVWLRPRLPLGWPCHFIVGSSQMSSETSMLCRMFSSWSCGPSVALVSSAQATRPAGSTLAQPDLRNKAVDKWLRSLPIFVRHFATARGINEAEGFCMLAQYGRTSGIINDLSRCRQSQHR
jgi:hypothetical protein